MKSISFDDVLKEELKDPEFNKEFQENQIRVKVGVSLLKARENAGLSRKKLADATGMSVKNVREAEQGNDLNASIKLITRLMQLVNKESVK